MNVIYEKPTGTTGAITFPAAINPWGKLSLESGWHYFLKHINQQFDQG
jgi:hypothetical protein